MSTFITKPILISTLALSLVPIMANATCELKKEIREACYSGKSENCSQAWDNLNVPSDYRCVFVEGQYIKGGFAGGYYIPASCSVKENSAPSANFCKENVYAGRRDRTQDECLDMISKGNTHCEWVVDFERQH